MPEIGEPHDAIRPSGAPVRKHVRHRRRPWLVRYRWTIPVVLVVVLAPLAWNKLFNTPVAREPLAGYLTDPAKVEEEYLSFTGKPLNPAAEHEFDRATELMRTGDYGRAVVVLEAASKQIPVPAVFNDLGVLYRKINDGQQALRAFRDALARDHDYEPVRANLRAMNMVNLVDPTGAEAEPNDNIQHANALWIDRPIQAVISPGVGDVDCYWFTTPRSPRDRISIEVVSRAATLTPRLHIFDEHGNLITGLKEAPGAGMPVRYEFSPPPNTLYYIEVDGAFGSSGQYTVAANALHAYDSYEPNDTVLTATRIVLNQPIDANIMDSDDTDFYSFVSPAAATIDIDVTSRSPSLIPGVATFAPDLHNIDFSADPKGPGASVHHTLKVEANQMYYVQVFSKNESSGAYRLVLK